MTPAPLPARLAAIYRRRGRKVRVIELPDDPAAAALAKEQARREWPGVTLIFTTESEGK